ncbi:pyridoxamine 5'-phosphate oxidase family protein [Hoyosella rhizosphaerae]|uniref:Pyridoxamine 5'-phosphate oxidase N-terminal domain-containing protein n=1 Tax=Hoyosella rhizosphaerae TaxID=1755582 RepID=A0A916U124_9ACTN|nr:pyridoxamine 5'-phosphate oxidase family protein [Hoyosella rhizosphaerae]MBN4927054.1 pyridoxamine 5'-phosphate oxidase family protein [Hoyosella rhizosphaerae]GGC54396.1 hypothetical protein GCM10011410_03460 [Hoyosella rhizosphaerae]
MDTATHPTPQLDERFSAPGATEADWDRIDTALTDAEVYWISTVRPPGQPHVTPLIGIWRENEYWFCTGADEQKAKNLAANARATVTTGTNVLDRGVDVVIEGKVQVETNAPLLQTIAAQYIEKYGSGWTFDVVDGHFEHADGGRAVVYRLTPTTVFAFTKGAFSQTRFTFERAHH